MSTKEQTKEQLPKQYIKEFENGIFEDVDQDVKKILANTQKLRQYKISIRKSLPKELFCTDITPVYCSDTLDGTIVESNVRIGYFTVGFNMIFNDCLAPVHNTRLIAKGGMGSIYSFQSPNNDQQYVAKRIRISSSLENKSIEGRLKEHLKLRQVIMEFAIYKIADLFDFGPKVVNFGFDIVCYKDMAEFYLEKCEDIKSVQSYRLKYCVRLMHSISFTHRDIKPGNLLLSKSKGRMVLTDFGLAKAIRQKIGQKTNSAFCGTKAFLGDEMKKIESISVGLVDLFINDLQCASLTLQYIKEQYDFCDSEMDFDFTPYSSAQSQQPFSTTDTSPQLSTPIQYDLLNKIYTLYSKNKCLDTIEYDWIKFENSLNEQQKHILNNMINNSSTAKSRYLIYCYGYSSKLLEKMQKEDKELFYDLKIHFSSQKAQIHLRNDFMHKFSKILKIAEKIKTDSLNKNQKEREKDKAKYSIYYQKLQFLLLNQFKTIGYSQTAQIKDLYEKMKSLRSLNSLDPIWDLAIIFVQNCMKNTSDQIKQSKAKQIIDNLKFMAGQDQKKLFEYLIDMLTLSFSSSNTVQRLYIYQELVKVHHFLSPTKQLFNNCILMKLTKNKQSIEYIQLKQQISNQLKQLMINSDPQNSEKQLLTECLAIYLYQEGDYQKSVEQYNILKNNQLLQFGMSKQIGPILYSIADCQFKLGKYRGVTKTYRQIRRATGQVTSQDYQVLGQSYFMLRNYIRAKKYYTDCMNISSDKTSTCEYRIGCCWMEMMKWENAIKLLQNSIISKDIICLINYQYFQAQIKITECQSYMSNDKSLSYFQNQYYKTIHSIQNSQSKLSAQQKRTLLINIYTRLQILYQKYKQDYKRKGALQNLQNMNFIYQQDNLYQRAGIYYCSGMLQQSFLYAYASGRKLKLNIILPDYFQNSIIQRKQRLSKILQKQNKQFKIQFNCLKNRAVYTVPDNKQDLQRAAYCNTKLKSLLFILQPFYLKEIFSEMNDKAHQFGEQIMNQIKLIQSDSKTDS